MLIRTGLLFALLAGAAQEQRPHPIVPGFERFGEGAEGGRLLLGELNCVTCHKPDAAAAEHFSVKKAPLLAESGSHLRYEWVRDFIADPQKAKPGATMPQPTLAAEEIDALAHFLMSLKRTKPLEGAGGAPAKAKEIFNRAGCAACHSPLDGPAIPGSVPLPDLRAKFPRPVSLAAFLLDPLAFRPSGRMPKMNLTPAEATALAVHFVGLPPRDADAPADTAPGIDFQVYEGGFSKVPDFDALRHVSTGTTVKVDVKLAKKESSFALRFRGYLEVPVDGVYTFYTHSDDGSVLKIGSTVVVNNDGIHGGTEQSGSIQLKAGKHAFSLGFIQGGGGAELRLSWEGPKFGKREIPAAAFSRPKEGPPLLKEAAPGAEFAPDAALVAKGRELFSAKRCASCHEGVPGTKPLEFKPLAQIPNAGGCLSGKPANFSLSPAQVRSMSAAIREIAAAPKPAPAERVARAMTAFNCYACHERDRKGGPSAERNALFVTTGDDMGDEGRIPPHLTGVGAKLRREWLQTVLATGSKVRPYMASRMPVFGAANLGTLAEDFEKADAAVATPVVKSDPDLVKAGRLLTGTKGMSCVTCHMFQSHKSLGIPGMDLVHMAQRLRRDWFSKYLLDPPSLRPGTRMPTYWPEGRSVRKDILEGDSERQIEALWQFLAEGGRAKLPIGVGPQPIPLIPVEEAIIYRNFIQGAGPRAIAVGYPEKAHLAFDAQAMRLAMLWRGDFIDASKHWVDRGSGFQSPAGEDVVACVDGVPFLVQKGPDFVWPKATGREAGYQFEGYELDAKRRPTFQYSYGDYKIRDFFEAVDAKPQPYFKRTLTISGVKPAEGRLWFRAAAGAALKVKVEGAAAMQRGTELFVPVEFKDGSCTIEVIYQW